MRALLRVVERIAAAQDGDGSTITAQTEPDIHAGIKYYIAYRLILESQQARKKAVEQIKGGVK
jgi:uncharacterized protein YcbX